MKTCLKIAFVSLIFLFTGYRAEGQVPDSSGFVSFRPDAFYAALQKETRYLLIDVREPVEFRKRRLVNAVNLPSSGELKSASDTIDRLMPLYVYCTSGIRSKKASKLLAGKGFLKVFNLEGGIMAWKKEGLPIDRKRRKTDK